MPHVLFHVNHILVFSTILFKDPLIVQPDLSDQELFYTSEVIWLGEDNLLYLWFLRP